MNRRDYHDQRRRARQLEVEAGLLRGTHWMGATVSAALRLRAELTPPPNEEEAERNARLADLHRALRLAQQAKQLRTQALRIVRYGVAS